MNDPTKGYKRGGASYPAHISELVDDGIRRIEAVVGMALRGNPATDAAVACIIGGKRSGRRVGRMTNCAASYSAVEHAVEIAAGAPLTILTCSWPRLDLHIGNQFFDRASRIKAKLGSSRVIFRSKSEDRRFELVNAFAKVVLQSDDPIWLPSPIETQAATAGEIERMAEGRIESPAESPVYRALRIRFPEPVKFSLEQGGRMFPAFRGKLGTLVPQFSIGAYRADFAVVSFSVRVVVEVDGFTYHSSRESFENDRKRDRELLMQGWPVMRFPASEALYEPEACAQQVIDFLEGGEG